MCGICGAHYFRSRRPVEAETLARMNQTLEHRGPDGEGSFAEGDAGIAMRRLSIIDLDGGWQPIWNEDRTVAVVCNGEIYNYKTLRNALQGRGHIFATESDVEVITHAYEEHGVDCVKHLQGMFAFAIWDRTRRRLMLGRDRFGIKPLFYAMTADGLLFGSEIKALLAAGVPRVLDAVALDQYLSHFCVPTPRTIFRDIRRVPPGHVLLSDGGEPRCLEYWDLAYEPEPFRGDEGEYVEGLRAHLKQAVSTHLQSDVPLGAFLSGGLDSGAVVAEMRALVPEGFSTFTVGFAERSYDERAAAAEVSRRFQTTHHEIAIKVDWSDLLPRMARWFDEPYGDYAAIGSYFASKLAREEVKVALSGDGGDEVLAGYPTHYAHRVARLYRMVPAPVRQHIIAPLVRRLPTSMDRISFDYKAKRFVEGAELPFEEAHLRWKVIFTEAQKARLYQPDVQAARDPDGSGMAVFAPLFERVAHLDPLSQLLYVDARTFLLDDNLTRVDRTSMANSLEVRVPFLDDNLFEFLRRVPSRVKQQGWTTKRMLRKAMTGILPDEIVAGAKKGFTPPMPHWLRNDLRPMLLELLSPASLRAIGLFDPAYVTGLIDDHLNGRADHNRQLWALMSMVQWWREYRPVMAGSA
jgi:asparagine synthase (glutamine-hydrolysing)